MKKIVSMLVCLAVLFTLFAMPASALGGELANAKNYTIGSVASGLITSTDESDVYAFNLWESGKINVHYIAQIERSALKLYDASGKEIWSSNPGWNSTVQQISFKEDIHLSNGKYYFSVSKYYGYGSYNLKISYNTAYESFAEPQGGNNNTILTANGINVNKTYQGQIALNDNVDTYKFVLNEAGKINLNFVAQIERSALKLYDASGKEIWYSDPSWNSTVQQISFSESIYLTKGTYYFSVSKYYNYGNYRFNLGYANSYESFSEALNGDNNTILDADTVELNKKYIGQIALNDNVDTYKISLPGGSYKLTFKGYFERAALKLYDGSGKEIWYSNPNWNSTTQQISFEEVVSLSKGTYYFSVSRYYGNGVYNFTFDKNVLVYIDGNKVNFDQNPVIQDGRTLVPVRAIFEALGATVEWDDATQTVTSKRGNVTIKMTIDSNIMYRNNTVIRLDVAPIVLNSRTLVPARAIAEAYGCNVVWDNNAWTVNITN